jgi:predicted MPP superfamily phosphohydrolase
MYWFLLLLAAIGHTILWVALVNRVHGLGIDRRLRNVLTLSCVSLFAVMPFVVGAAFISIFRPEPTAATTLFYSAAWIYLLGCVAVCVVATAQRLIWRFHSERRGALLANHSNRIKVGDQVTSPLSGPGVASLLCRLPGNEALSLSIQHKDIAIPRLAAPHGGIRIAHLADLHMSGRLTKAYFQHVVEETNRCEADFVAITGDIVEYEKCVDWIPDTLGRLRAASGVYYVLGNHDRRIEKNRLHAALRSAGLIHLGGQVISLSIREMPVVLCGNELPWFAPAADLSGCAPHSASGLPLRIALVHTPDQFDWSVENDVDLMLAGHVHGGQVCLPILGPITAPSLYGVRYAAGTFRRGNTVMHVSRGTSALTPLRWNCPPEIAVLTLRSQNN